MEELYFQVALRGWNPGALDERALKHAAIDAVRREVRFAESVYGRRGSGQRFAKYWAQVEDGTSAFERVLDDLAVQQTLARLSDGDRRLLDLLGQHGTRRAVASAIGRDEWTVGDLVRGAVNRFLEVYNDE